MTFKNKLACSTLTDNQHKQIIQNTEYFFLGIRHQRRTPL